MLLPPGAVSPQAARSSNSSTGRKRTLAEALGVSPTASGSASAPAPAPKPKPKPAKPGAAAAAQPAGAGGGGELLEKFGEPERPLRLVIVGHNPSDHAWSSGEGAWEEDGRAMLAGLGCRCQAPILIHL